MCTKNLNVSNTKITQKSVYKPQLYNSGHLVRGRAGGIILVVEKAENKSFHLGKGSKEFGKI